MTRRRDSSIASAYRFHRLCAERACAPLPEPPVLPAAQAAIPGPPPEWQPRHERMPISREQIAGLLASTADPFFARVCERALRGEAEAINACKAAVYGLA